MSAYQVLARKWRPKTFKDLIGQQHVIKALQNALSQGMLHHAYLLTGTRGVGKTTIARILAKSLNCEQVHNGEPCGQCQNCQDIDAGRFVDLLEIDAASNTGIDNIREVLENAQYAPTTGKYKVYIIDEVHMLSKSAFNAMLKTLEEPPAHVKFILATTDPHKVPITVLSRCLQFVLRNMTPQQVAEHLAFILNQEQINHDQASLALLGRAAQGSMRDALSLLDQAIAMGSGTVNEQDVRQMIGAVDKRYLYELLSHLVVQNGTALIQQAQQMANNAIGFDNALTELAALLQKIALYQTIPNAVAEDDPDHETIKNLAPQFSSEQIQLYYQCVIHGKQDLSLAPDEYAGFVMTLIRMLAFAPLAANTTPINTSIENAQLHNQDSTKKQMLPETHHNTMLVSGNHKHTSPTKHTNTVERENTEHQIPTQPQNTPISEIHQHNDEVPTSHQHIEPQHHHLDNKQSTTITQTSPIATQPTITTYPNNIASPSHIEHPTAITVQTFLVEPQPTTEINSTVVPNQTEQLTPTKQQSSMPELNATNWPLIAQRISQQIAAARLILENMAWIDFKDGVLHLALTHETTHNNLDKSYFKRIAEALSQAYQQPIQIQTQSYKEGQGWETIDMRRNRIHAEQIEQAKQLMQQDKAVQQIQNLFGAKWLNSSIHLKPQENN